MITISNYRVNCLGTLSITLQAKHMRKPQEFCVYPMQKGGDTEKINIQSDTYWAVIYPKERFIEFSSSHSNVASVHFLMDRIANKIKTYKIDKETMAEILEKIGETSGEKVGGKNILKVFCDNSGAEKFKV